VARGALHFEAPDPLRFPALRLAAEALATGGTAPAVLGAANEVAVEAFLGGALRFGEIARVVETVLGKLEVTAGLELAELREADRRARAAARACIRELR